MAISPARRITQGIVSALALAALSLVGIYSFRTWRASADLDQALRLGRSSAAQAQGYLAVALRWRPDDADLWRWRATFAAFDAPAAADGYARRAAGLNPHDWRAWQTLGLLDYQLGDMAASRRDLVEATRYDHGFLSHFTLGNLALAQGNAAEFRREMTVALAIAPADRVDYTLRAIVAHAQLSPDELAALLPAGRADVVAQGIQFYLLQGKFAAAIASWNRLHCHSYQFADCRTAALALTNGLAAATFASAAPPRARPTAAPAAYPEMPAPAILASAALAVWNQAVRHLILAQPAAAVGSVADGRFQYAWVGPAFAWHATGMLPLQAVPAIGQGSRAVRIPFNGYQPDQADLLATFAAVEPGASYSVAYRSRRQRPGDETGLRLDVMVAPGRDLVTIPARLAMTWSLDSDTFTVPKDVHLVQLVFSFARPRGQIRLHDPVLIADVTLQRVVE